jgi:hypothetical protein
MNKMAKARKMSFEKHVNGLMDTMESVLLGLRKYLMKIL